MAGIRVYLSNIFPRTFDTDLLGFLEVSAYWWTLRFQLKISRHHGYDCPIHHLNLAKRFRWQSLKVPKKTNFSHHDGWPKYHFTRFIFPISQTSHKRTSLLHSIHGGWSALMPSLACLPLCNYRDIQTTSQYFDSSNATALSMWSSVSQCGDFFAFLITLIVFEVQSIP